MTTKTEYLSPMRDTLDPAEAVRIAAIRRLSPEVRLRNALDLSELAMRLAMARIRGTHPELREHQVLALLHRQARGAAGD
jgi:hypothetical protein